MNDIRTTGKEGNKLCCDKPRCVRVTVIVINKGKPTVYIPFDIIILSETLITVRPRRLIDPSTFQTFQFSTDKNLLVLMNFFSKLPPLHKL